MDGWMDGWKKGMESGRRWRMDHGQVDTIDGKTQDMSAFQSPSHMDHVQNFPNIPQWVFRKIQVFSGQ